MITLLDIQKSIVKILVSKNFTIMQGEIEKGFERPSFFIEVTPLTQELTTKNIKEKLFTIEILYFSENKTRLENIKMYDFLEKSFTPYIQINDRKILTRRIRSETVDGVLSFSFDLFFYDNSGIEENTCELMQNIDLALNKGEY